MKVILQQQVPTLGQKHQVVEVNAGYARNFLFPRSLAIVANETSLAQREFQQKRAEARQEKLQQEAKSLAKKLKGTTLKFKRKASAKGQLFGSVTAKEILAALKAELSWTFTADQLVGFNPLRALGEHKLQLQLSPDLTAQFQLKIEAE